jgi:hypothetical protein
LETLLCVYVYLLIDIHGYIKKQLTFLIHACIYVVTWYMCALIDTYLLVL